MLLCFVFHVLLFLLWYTHRLCRGGHTQLTCQLVPEQTSWFWGILWDYTLMELISSVLIWLMDIKARLCGPSPLTPSVIRLSHQLIKPGEFTPLAMLGPAVSPQCPGRPGVSGKPAGFTGAQQARASDLGWKCYKSQSGGDGPKCSLK